MAFLANIASAAIVFGAALTLCGADLAPQQQPLETDAQPCFDGACRRRPPS
jgi:hypothetical protein